jgi:HEAT repeat protein
MLWSADLRAERRHMTNVTILVVVCVISAWQQPDQEETIHGVPLSAYAASMEKKQFRDQRLRAMTTIARYAKSPGQHIPLYLDALEDPDETVRATAAQSLGEMGGRLPSLAGKLLPQLSVAFEDPQQRVRAAVALAFRSLGPAARSQLANLRRHYDQDKSRGVREYSLAAMVAVTEGADDHLDMLVLALNQDEFPISTEWLRDTALIASESEQAVAAVRRALHRGSGDEGVSSTLIRERAVSALGHMGPVAKAATADLFEMLKEPIEYKEVYARRRRGEPLPRTAVEKEPAVCHLRLILAWAITRIDNESVPKLFSLVKEQLADANADMRLSSTIIVSRLSHLPEAQVVAETVAQLAEDDSPDVRILARLASLRLADPAAKGQNESRFSDMPLPRDITPPPDVESMQASLKSKIGELIGLCDVDDKAILMRSLMLPSRWEEALIQGDVRREMVEDGDNTARYMKSLFEGVQYDKIRIADRLATVPTAARPNPLHFFWFDGNWYLSGE